VATLIEESKSVVDEFNPYSLSDIKEWDFLTKNGHWKDGSRFINMDFPINWNLNIMNKMANCLVDLMLIEESIGVPPVN